MATTDELVNETILVMEFSINTAMNPISPFLKEISIINGVNKSKLIVFSSSFKTKFLFFTRFIIITFLSQKIV